MRKNIILKMIILNSIIAAVNILLFSNAFFHIKIFGNNAFQSALGVTAIIMSIVVFLYGNYKFLTEKPKLIKNNDIKTLNDCIVSIRRNMYKKTFTDYLSKILNQIARFENKDETINDILLQKFNETEMSYLKFKDAVEKVEEVIYLNIKSILNRINAFDESEYAYVKKQSIQYGEKPQSVMEKIDIYNEYIEFVENAVEDNEKIILKLDKLLFEVTKFNSIESGEISNMDAMKEIDDLINNTKWYK